MGGEVQHFVAGGDDADGDAFPDRHVPDAAGEQRAHVPRTQVVVAREQQFRRHDVFSDAPDVLPREGRGLNRDFVSVLYDLFDHDHGVAAFGHGVSGVHGEAGFPGPERQGVALSRRERGPRVDRVAVHRRRMECGRGVAGMHRVRQHPARRLVRRDRFFADQFFTVDGRLHPRHRLSRRNRFQVDVSFHMESL